MSRMIVIRKTFWPPFSTFSYILRDDLLHSYRYVSGIGCFQFARKKSGGTPNWYRKIMETVKNHRKFQNFCSPTHRIDISRRFLPRWKVDFNSFLKWPGLLNFINPVSNTQAQNIEKFMSLKNRTTFLAVHRVPWVSNRHRIDQIQKSRRF